MASIITRHPCLSHLDISKTNLKREEVLFIGLALSTSKALLCIHLTANELPYYDRLFLRSVIAARVNYEYRQQLAKQATVRSNKDRNQVMALDQADLFDPATSGYLKNLRSIDQKREGLDFEIQDILQEMDVVV